MQNQVIFFLLLNFLFFQACSQETIQKIDNMVFPTFKAELLTQEKVTFPEYAQGQITLIVFVFEEMGRYQKAQNQSLKWQSFWENDLKAKGVNFFEIPAMSSFFKPLKRSTDRWMRQGIPADLHGNVACVWGDKRRLINSLGVQNLSDCQVFVLDATGKVMYKGAGEISSKKREAILSKL